MNTVLQLHKVVLCFDYIQFVHASNIKKDSIILSTRSLISSVTWPVTVKLSISSDLLDEKDVNAIL